MINIFKAIKAFFKDDITLASTQGQVRRRKVNSEYFLEVGNMRFRVSKKLYNALQDNQRCRIYYAPLSKEVVSVDLI
jgi:hypothetical protein